MAGIPAVVSVAQAKWQRLIPVSMEVDADLIDIWADTGDHPGSGDSARNDCT